MSLQSRIFKMNCTKADTERDKKLKIPENVVVYRDIAYDAKHQLLDVTIPKKAISADKAKKLPVIISIHGGGYVYGNKDVYQFYAADLAKNGFVVINFNYRLAPRFKFPAPLEDMNNVMKWLAKNAENYFADIENVFVVGDSAGAQIASQYAAIYSNPAYESTFSFKVPRIVKIKGVGLNCGRFTVSATEEGLMADYIGKKVNADDPRLKVLEAINSNYPPAFVMTSFYDFLKEEAKPMYDLLKSKGIKTEYRLYGDEGQFYMCHVFHCNLNLKEAKKCNKDECDFFKSLIK